MKNTPRTLGARHHCIHFRNTSLRTYNIILHLSNGLSKGANSIVTLPLGMLMSGKESTRNMFFELDGFLFHNIVTFCITSSFYHCAT
jgi:hypothetical protein